MALMKCQECGHTYSDQATACPKCGCPNQIQVEKENKFWKHFDDQELFQISVKRRIQIISVSGLFCFLLFHNRQKTVSFLDILFALFMFSFIFWMFYISFTIGASILGVIGGVLGVLGMIWGINILPEIIYPILGEKIGDAIAIILIAIWGIWFYIWPFIYYFLLRKEQKKL